MKSISEYSMLAEKEIKNLSLPVMDLPGLYDPIVYAMNGGGKRLRPVLMLMTAEAFGMPAEDCVRPAVGIEMFHNFTLLHDDVMDRSETRRGRPTVHKRWDENTAILSGDAMLTLSTYLISEVADDKLPCVLEAFNMAAFKIYEGQARDMEFEHMDDVTLDDYLLMVSQKTGALLGASCKIGALVAGATREASEAMYDFGLQLGIAFQIQDDFLDVYGDAATFGKPIGGDIVNGKKTFIWLSALKTADASQRDALLHASRLEDASTKIRTIRNLYTKLGMQQVCDKAIARHCSAALKSLKKADLTDETRIAFKNLVDKLIDRKK